MYAGFSHALALTYNLQTSVTSSIMIGSPDFLKGFVAYIKDRPDLVEIPGFLVLVLAQVVFNLAEFSYTNTRYRSQDVESKTGHGTNFIHQHLGDLKQLDLPEMTKSVHSLASQIAIEEQRVKDCLLRHERLAEFDKQIQEARYPVNSLEWDRNAQEMRQHSEWLVGSLRSILQGYENLAKAAMLQMSIVSRKSSNAQPKLDC